MNPMVGFALMLEHGCEKHHNDSFKKVLQTRGMAVDRLGWASIQLDGGIEKVKDKTQEWFKKAMAEAGGAPRTVVKDLGAINVGIMVKMDHALLADGGVGDPADGLRANNKLDIPVARVLVEVVREVCCCRCYIIDGRVLYRLLLHVFSVGW